MSSSGKLCVTRAEFTKKEVFRCMLCGGSDCPRCGLNAYKAVKEPAIARLHSHWVTDSIIAMQRPIEAALDDGALADMVRKKITAVFNLTEPGEHPFCGGGNLSATGFPYNPEKLMSVGSKNLFSKYFSRIVTLFITTIVKHFNYNWRDMTIPSISLMKDIVQIAVNELNNGGKVRYQLTLTLIILSHYLDILL